MIWFYENSTSPWWSSSQKPIVLASLTMRRKKKNRQIQIEVQNTWPVLLKTINFIKNKESLRNKESLVGS